MWRINLESWNSNTKTPETQNIDAQTFSNCFEEEMLHHGKHAPVPTILRPVVRVLSLRSSVIHGFVTEPWYSRHVRVSCERALSSACLVSCWSVVFRFRHSCLEFRLRDGVRTLALHVLSLCVSVRAFVFYLVLCGTQLVYSLAACFHVVMSCVNTWLMIFLISCVLMSCFAHGWWFVCWPCACVFVLCEHVASVLVFCVPRALMSICLDPTHLITCLLIHFPQLFSLVTLLICSL